MALILIVSELSLPSPFRKIDGQASSCFVRQMVEGKVCGLLVWGGEEQQWGAKSCGKKTECR